MAGGDVSFLLGEKKGAPYGNQMWEYIKTSVDPTTRKETHQKVRKVSYAPDFFFDVQTNRTMKFVFTGDKPVNVPRLYEPIWPKNGDLIMDTTYKSIKPCRPDGVASDCCIWDIHEDWQERNPLATDCSAMHLEAKNLFAMDGGCPKDSNGRHLNHACLESGDVNGKVPERYLSLWTHYGASGPFTNSKGQPMNGLPMKCICYGLEIGSKASNVDYFVVRNLGPSQCGKSRGLFRKMRPLMSIPCDGSFALQTPPQKDILTQYVEEGFDASSFRKILRLEKNKLIISDVASVFELLITFMKRKGKKDWPSLNKFPFNGDMDTCKEKGVVPVPFPVVSITPYMFGTRDPTNAADLPLIGLCAAYSLTQFFCPSHQNALLKPVIEWTNDELGRPYGVFSDGTHWKPMGLDECSRKCKMEPEGTAYIGEGPYGLTV